MKFWFFPQPGCMLESSSFLSLSVIAQRSLVRNLIKPVLKQNLRDLPFVQYFRSLIPPVTVLPLAASIFLLLVLILFFFFNLPEIVFLP